MSLLYPTGFYEETPLVIDDGLGFESDLLTMLDEYRVPVEQQGDVLLQLKKTLPQVQPRTFNHNAMYLLDPDTAYQQ